MSYCSGIFESSLNSGFKSYSAFFLSLTIKQASLFVSIIQSMRSSITWFLEMHNAALSAILPESMRVMIVSFSDISIPIKSQTSKKNGMT